MPPTTTKTSTAQLMHKIKSNLAIISGYLQLMQEKLPADSTEHEWMSKATKECDALLQNLELLKQATTTK